MVIMVQVQHMQHHFSFVHGRASDGPISRWCQRYVVKTDHTKKSGKKVHNF